MVRRGNLFALLIVLAVLVALPAGVFGYRALSTQVPGVRVIDVIARRPEEGGFAPDRLRLQVGEPVRLRISSPDVVHGLVIPDLGVEVDDIQPGKVVEVELTPGKAGRYAFACTRWCGADHWRMRGVIEVTDANGAIAPEVSAEPPLFQELGIDLDAWREPVQNVPSALPSPDRGEALGIELPESLLDPESRRALSPVEAFDQLRQLERTAGLTDDEVWDLVAHAWSQDIDPEAWARAGELYTREGAACHGASGKGDGPAGVGLPGLRAMLPAGTAEPSGDHETGEMGRSGEWPPAGPADFTDMEQMLSASDALLQGKLLRGGMGTGMPEYGSLYTDEEIEALVAFIRGFHLGTPSDLTE